MGLVYRIKLRLGYRLLLNVHTNEVHDIKNDKKSCSIRYMSDKNKKLISGRKYRKLLANGEISNCNWCIGENSKEFSDADHSWWIG